MDRIERSSDVMEFSDYQLREIGNNNLKLWSAHTNVDRFGEVSKNGVQNEISLVVTGQNKNAVNEFRMTLDLKNSEIESSALSEFSSVADEIFSTFEIPIPTDLNSKISNGEQYYFENDLLYILLKKSELKEKNLAISKYPELDPKKEIEVERWDLILISK